MRTADVVTRVPCIRPGHCAVLLRVGFHEKRVPLSRDIIMLRDRRRSWADRHWYLEKSYGFLGETSFIVTNLVIRAIE